MTHRSQTHDALRRFASSVSAKLSQLTRGEPEDQLRAPFETFIRDAGRALDLRVLAIGETLLPHHLGRPDFTVHVRDLPAGHVELKAPGKGAATSRFRNHDKKQWQRFRSLPNILYTDGNEWALYRSGTSIDEIVRLRGDIVADGAKAVDAQNAAALGRLLRDFLSWEPESLLRLDESGNVDLERFADTLAPLCKALRDDVRDSLRDPASPIVQLARDWRKLLFPDASDDQFADAYAQTVTFAILLGRSEGANPLSLTTAETALAEQHGLLARALQVLTDRAAYAEIRAPLDLILRVIAAVPLNALSAPHNPWLHFYEHFLEVYDPKLRRDAGAYYTPVEVVRAQVRLVDDLLVNHLGKRFGFANTEVVTLDPAVGTGTYLLAVIEHALERVQTEEGAGAVPGQATALADTLCGFELMVGPYAVAQLRVSRALRAHGAQLPPEGSHIYLTDTLESPNATPIDVPLFVREIAVQHAKALNVKCNVPVIVCLGNPPYDRHEAVEPTQEASLSRYGGWVRFGDPPSGRATVAANAMKKRPRSAKAQLMERQRYGILRTFIDPVVEGGHGVRLKNLYNLYVYFWRWALWKVFEHVPTGGPGIVSFVTASSYLDGDAFRGMRQHLRSVCDAIWVLDLGGERRGTRQTENVFAIQTPVAIAVAMRTGQRRENTPARVRYARIDGTREDKLAFLDRIGNFSEVRWHLCPDDWQAPFRPAGRGHYFAWPLLTDLMPWQHSGAQVKRTWPICFDHAALQARWAALLAAKDRAVAFHETRDRKVSGTYPSLARTGTRARALAVLSPKDPCPAIVRYAYRSFDRQWLLADNRVADFLRPDLWRAHGNRQVYLTSLLNHPLGMGPAITACALLPDLDHFRGSYGAKHVLPLYRNADSNSPNVLPGLTDLLSATYRTPVSHEDLLGYMYGVLAQPAFTSHFMKELERRELRVPITKDAALFAKMRDVGARLIWLHTYGERLAPPGTRAGEIPQGSARCRKAVPENVEDYPDSYTYDAATEVLVIGEGMFAPVAPAVYEFEVSGLKVLQSWLKYRMKGGGGKKSSPLDAIRPERWTREFTTELLELLWVLEHTLAIYPAQEKLLAAILDGECFSGEELPSVPEEMRGPPRVESMGGLFGADDER